MNVFIKQSDLEKISSLPENIAHEKAIRVPLDENLEIVKTKIEEQYPDLLVETWKESQGYLSLMDDLLDKMMEQGVKGGQYSSGAQKDGFLKYKGDIKYGMTNIIW